MVVMAVMVVMVVMVLMVLMVVIENSQACPAFCSCLHVGMISIYLRACPDNVCQKSCKLVAETPKWMQNICFVIPSTGCSSHLALYCLIQNPGKLDISRRFGYAQTRPCHVFFTKAARNVLCQGRSNFHVVLNVFRKVRSVMFQNVVVWPLFSHPPPQPQE